MNGLERFLIEKIRVNTIMDFLGMKVTQAEIISTSLVILGVIFIIFALKKKVPTRANGNIGTTLE
jgi:phosphatidylglycerol---prolipoprotein diacylglyceryl transferase